MISKSLRGLLSPALAGLLLSACATPNQKLVRAVARGDRDGAEASLGQGAELNAKVEDRALWFDCPLHAALRTGNIELAKWLLDKGADVNLACAFNETGLALAARLGDVEALGLLIARGAAPDIRSSTGRTPLQVAVAQNRPDLVRLLLAAGADVSNEDDEGLTPLSEAVFPEDRAGRAFEPASGLARVKLESARLLADKGADPARANRKGLSPLGTALCTELRSGEASLADFLLERGASLGGVDVEKLPPHCHLSEALAQDLKARPGGETFLARLEARAEGLRRRYEAQLHAEEERRALNQREAGRRVQSMSAGSDCGYGVCPVGQSCVAVVDSGGGTLYHACRSGSYLYRTK